MKTHRKSVTMEPELEKLAGNWPPWKRLAFARKLARWNRQLVVSARILLARQQPRPKRGLRRLSHPRLVRN
ncbi:MAG: hypothetical protein H7A46_07020 [Verrucomicrobiales bacterium]|nr:hypothetical protein [Verrucomicrobiales bacterium]